MELSCFKAYDIRGKVPQELNEEIALRIGRAFASFLNASRVIVGRDVRLTSQPLAAALASGLQDAGCDVLDIGVCGTEQVYYSTFAEGVDGGIMVTASHNPMDYNGMKLVREGSRPVSGDTGLHAIRELVRDGVFQSPAGRGKIAVVDGERKYVEHLLGYVDTASLRPFRVVVNSGNGCAGRIIDLLQDRLPVEFVKVHHEPDGTFPNGIPNPLLPENRSATAEAVVSSGAHLGIAWDGDFDRCFLFDENGEFIEGYYIVGLLAEAMLRKHPGSSIIHDPRLTWNTVEMVEKAGGKPVMSKTGHAFIKERMRLEDAVYGGEMSAHHYFRDFAYCDSGMIPWLLVLGLMSSRGKTLSELVGERMKAFPASGEINRVVADPAAVLASVSERYGREAVVRDMTDGLSLEFDRWRFNLRSSNTEPVMRLNVESRGDEGLMRRKTEEILSVIGEK